MRSSWSGGYPVPLSSRCVTPWAIAGSILLVTSLVSAVTFKFCTDDHCGGNCDEMCVDQPALQCCWVDMNNLRARSVQVLNADVDVPVESFFYSSLPNDIEPKCNGDPNDIADHTGSFCQDQIGGEFFTGALWAKPDKLDRLRPSRSTLQTSEIFKSRKSLWSRLW